ncbi:hypothetical protein DPMN_157925 [Dreissena polymorpha]|uniref:Uncharacterized protein n=2 Tax=Dreissena polymorpha TaxID=45954 RepID=A0A9D4EI72_DREPO|nr:hypothetical protein DPMN_157925 [Dreissena polymorpha]
MLQSGQGSSNGEAVHNGHNGAVSLACVQPLINKGQPADTDAAGENEEETQIKTEA